MTDIAHLRALLAAAIQRPWFTHPHDVPGEPFPWTTSVFVTGGAQDSVPRLLVARADSPDAALIAEAVAVERARIVAGVRAEASERIEDDGNIGRRAYGSLGIKPSDSGYIEVVGRAAVLRIIEGEL